MESVATTLTMCVAAGIVDTVGDEFYIATQHRDDMLRMGVRAWLEERLGIAGTVAADGAAVAPTGPVATSAPIKATPPASDDLDDVVARAEAFAASLVTGTADANEVVDVVASVIALAGELRRIRRLWKREVDSQPMGPMRESPDGALVLPVPDGTIGHTLVRGLLDMLDAANAINYVQIGGYSAKAGGRVEAVVQRVGKLSPCDARDAAEAALGRAVALLREHGIAWDGPVAFVPSPRPAVERLPTMSDDHGWLRIDVRRDPNVMMCMRCGCEQDMATAPAPMLQAMLEAFATQHAQCEEGDGEVVRAMTAAIERRARTGES